MNVKLSATALRNVLMAVALVMPASVLACDPPHWNPAWKEAGWVQFVNSASSNSVSAMTYVKDGKPYDVECALSPKGGHTMVSWPEGATHVQARFDIAGIGKTRCVVPLTGKLGSFVFEVSGTFSHLWRWNGEVIPQC